MEIAIFEPAGVDFLLRWIHFFAGVTWIGLLYYFNFVQGEWFKETDAASKSAAIQKLVPRALFWFRWGAMFTFASGLAILLRRFGGPDAASIAGSGWGILILTGGALGTLMFLNVWLVIWPNQKVIIASATQVAGGGQALPQAAACAAKAGLASRTNTLFSIPMLFFMGAASHLPLASSADFNGKALAIALGVIIGLIEINGLKGKTGPITTVKGVIISGVLLTAVLYGVIEALT